MILEWAPNPILLQIGFVKIYYYSIFWMLSFIIGNFIITKIFINEKIKTILLDKLFIYIFCGTIIGARLGEILYDTNYMLTNYLEIFLPIKKVNSSGNIIKDYVFTGFNGLSSHGAALGIIIGAYIFKMRYLKKISLLYLLDIISIPIPIGCSLIRLGNFFNSEIIGKPTNKNWGVIFKNQSQLYGEIVPRHPTQIYESLIYIIIFIIIFKLYKKHKLSNVGLIFGNMITYMFTARFIIEFIKENQGLEYVANFLNVKINNGQILSIPFIVLGVFILTLKKNKTIR